MSALLISNFNFGGAKELNRGSARSIRGLGSAIENFELPIAAYKSKQLPLASRFGSKPSRTRTYSMRVSRMIRWCWAPNAYYVQREVSTHGLEDLFPTTSWVSPGDGLARS